MNKEILEDFKDFMEKEEKEYQQRLKIYKRRKESGGKIKVKVKTKTKYYDMVSLYPIVK